MPSIVETIVVTVTGANPQSFGLQAPVDIQTGSGGIIPVSLSGASAGVDTIVCTMPSHSYTSNDAEIAWQATSGPIATSPVAVSVYGNSGQVPGWAGFGGGLLGTITANSWVINQVFQNTPINGFNNQPTNVGPGGGYKLIPAVFVEQTAAGNYASSLAIPGSGSGSTGNPFIVDMTGYLIVKTPGTYTIYIVLANVTQAAVWIGTGATVISNNTSNTGGNPFPSTGPNTSFWSSQSPTSSQIMLAQNVGLPLYGYTFSAVVNFPSAGIYPIEAVYNQRNPIQFSGDNNGYFQLTYVSGNSPVSSENNAVSGTPTFFPVSKQAAPPAIAAGTGQLSLATTSGGTHASELELQGTTQTLYLKIQNVVYTNVPYIPLLEGVAGTMTLSGLALPPIPVPDNAATAAAVFNLSGDNTAFSGLLTVSAGTSPNFNLSYSGGPLVPHTALTNLVITAQDVAWYDGTDTTYDVFSATGGGGLGYNVLVNYLVNPTPFVASVTPTSLTADGANHVFAVTLTKPISPQQQGTILGTGNTIAPTFTWGGGVSTVSVAAILDGSGWLTGWNITAHVPASPTTITATLNATIQGTLTRLSGTSIVSNNFVYVNNVQIASISLLGSGLYPPVEYGFTVSPTAFVNTVSVTITATVYNKTNVSNTVSFLQRQAGTTTQSTLGTSSTPTSSTTGTVGGQTVFIKTYTLSTTSASFYPSLNLGFSCVDQNGLNMTPVYWDSTTFTHTVTGGGGGGGCPEVSMYVASGKQVQDVGPGFILDSLAGETSDYLTALPLCEPAEVMHMDFSTEECFYFRTENGAEVIVSGSTPVPCRESIEAIAQGQDAGEVIAYANQVRSGLHLITNIGSGPAWSMIEETYSVGPRRVARLYCGGRNFAAGKKPGKYIYTHNLQPIEPK